MTAETFILLFIAALVLLYLLWALLNPEGL